MNAEEKLQRGMITVIQICKIEACIAPNTNTITLGGRTLKESQIDMDGVMNRNDKKMQAILSLDGQRRYEHFVKQVADSESVWGLYNDGWALAETDDGVSVFPLWPAKEYAQLSAEGDWESFKPEEFSVYNFIDELLPNLEADGCLPGVFFTPSNRGLTPTVSQLIQDLQAEMSRY